VYAAIVIIGIIGLATDQILAFLGQRLFAWKNPRPSRLRSFLARFIGRRATAPIPVQSISDLPPST
jgi:NitT/TauT family transport system permease protein